MEKKYSIKDKIYYFYNRITDQSLTKGQRNYAKKRLKDLSAKNFSNKKFRKKYIGNGVSKDNVVTVPLVKKNGKYIVSRYKKDNKRSSHTFNNMVNFKEFKKKKSNNSISGKISKPSNMNSFYKVYE